MLNKVKMRPEVEQRFSELKTAMLLNVPFFASIWLDALTLKVGKFPELFGESEGTAGTNGRTIWFDEDFMMKLTLPESVFLFCHEIGHCMWLHMARAKQYESTGLHGHPFIPQLWNIAGDMIINDMLVKCQIGKMPQGGLLDTRFNSDMLIEDVYKALLDEHKKKPKQGGYSGDGGGDGSPSGQPGDGYGKTLDTHVPSESAKPDEVDLTDQEWRRVIQSAVDGAKAVGKLPAMLERLATELVNPQVRWQDVLRRKVVTTTVRVSTNWAQPHRRRLVTQKVYMPRRSGFTAGTIVVANDTSGSISDAELTTYVSELAEIFSSCNPERVFVLSCDAKLHTVEEFDQGHDIRSTPPQMKGGGGTSFRPVFEWIEEAGITPSALIYFTDLYGSFPDHEPDYPVIWCATSDERVPFGDVVRVKVQHT